MSGVDRSSSPGSTADHESPYNGIAQSFHWLIVALLAVQYLTKLVPTSWANEEALNAWHLAIGPTILVLMVLRLLWRATHRPPPAPATLPTSLRWLSRATHWGFYALLIVLPLMGWASASGFGATPYLLGIIPLPAIIVKDKGLAEFYGNLHGALALALLALIALHIAGVFYHVFLKQDGVVHRMLPLSRSK